MFRKKPAKTLSLFTLAGVLVLAPLSAQTSASALPPPFSRGVNFSQWFEADSPQRIQFSLYSETDFINVKNLGADVVRLPMRLHAMAGAAPNYELDPLFLEFLDRAVDWAEKYELHIILDNHSFDPAVPTTPDIEEVMIATWRQLAARYRDRSSFVFYEVLNEPHGIDESVWREMQGRVIKAIREVDSRHAIIAGGADYNSVDALSRLRVYDDSNAIYTFHFYDPYIFTHQGAQWGDSEPYLTDLRDVPFPPSAGKKPKLAKNLRGTWVDVSLSEYMRSEKASLKKMSAALDKVVEFSTSNNVPVFCGEFGVYMPNSQSADRLRWYRYTRDLFDSRNISWTMWDYYGGFGLFNKMTGGDFERDLNIPLAGALGFSIPEREERSEDDNTADFVFYGDGPARRTMVYVWPEKSICEFYCAASPFDGAYCLKWGDCPRYGNLLFFLREEESFARFAENDYCLEFAVRAAPESGQIEIRFIAAGDIPWRMKYTLDTSNISDGEWHTVKIPLSQMSESGAWVNEDERWYEPENAFSWERVQALEFSAEYEPLTERLYYFDNIRITK